MIRKDGEQVKGHRGHEKGRDGGRSYKDGIGVLGQGYKGVRETTKTHFDNAMMICNTLYDNLKNKTPHGS